MADVDRPHVVGIDVGGTFTDVVNVDEATGAVRIGKVSSTRSRESAGFMAGLDRTVDSLDRVGAIVHGTTVGTNALLERNGARTGIITTEGFADVLEMRRRDRPSTWGLWGDFVPVSPRDLRVGVAERTLADGTVLAHVDPQDVAVAAQQLLDRGRGRRGGHVPAQLRGLRERAGGRWGRCGPCGPTTPCRSRRRSSPRSASSSEPRPPRSTPTCSRSWAATWGRSSRRWPRPGSSASS